MRREKKKLGNGVRKAGVGLEPSHEEEAAVVKMKHPEVDFISSKKKQHARFLSGPPRWY